ncbi:MAG: hypothetical protein OSB05_04120 [Akkermansiaceae bacterium]|nr:hypothetical protein [Akkermansiaceae bacterium]
MKYLFVLLLLANGAFAETWIEILRTSDFQNNHPGRWVEITSKDSPPYEFHDHQRKNLERIVKGNAPIFPAASFKEDAFADFSFAQLSIGRLIEYHADQQDWDEIVLLFRLAQKIKSTISISEPALGDLIVASATSRTTFKITEPLAAVPLQEDGFAILKKKLGEMAFKQDKPLFWPENFPHQITTKQLVKHAITFDFKKRSPTSPPNPIRSDIDSRINKIPNLFPN